MTSSSDRCGDCPVPEGSDCILRRRGRCELVAQEAARKKVFPHADTYWTDFARQSAGVQVPPPAEAPTGRDDQLPAQPPTPPPSDPEDPGYPPLWKMGWSFVKDATKHVLNGMPKADPEVYELRRATCASCEHLTKEGRCGKGGCGCGMAVKASWAMTACPFGKWEK